MRVLPSEDAVADRLRVGLYGIQPGRQVYLFFGTLRGEDNIHRKGIYQLIEAIEHLSANECGQLCLVIAGQMDAAVKEAIGTRIATLQDSLPVQWVLLDEYVTESDVQALFGLSDVVLIPYQRHVGMSGILVRAAAAQNPVLASDYGLIGALVAQYSLGLAVDSTNPSELSKGIRRLLNRGCDGAFDPDRASEFAEINSATNFSSLLFDRLLAKS